ncbi:hypothetical protein B0J13DRAFT_650514 [Dactylonectria estremocensis]|uniref:Uncharacterized protein n=1 Tax=Dactylonectria estremocensis TaxID=1079267 RepID=A0A9P9FC35_9HYPO|nr:hypothetical protein B0J13DRAFT_650514 [Dactylonectria estremocensis]
MAESPGSVHWSASSRASSLALFENITDEREFDKLPSTVPDSQQNNTVVVSNPLPKKFSAIQEDITESVLSEGFSWPVQQPPRPGQFSRRPNHEPTRAPVPSLHFGQLPIVPREAQPSRSSAVSTSPVHRPAAPLDLAELELFKSSTPAKHSSVEPDTSQSLSRTEKPDFQEYSARTGYPQLPIPPVGSNLSENGKSQSPSDIVSAWGKKHAETNLRQPPIMNKSTSSQVPITNQPVDFSKLDKPFRSARWDLQDLKQMKISLPHEKRVHQTIRNDPPSSVCGDLERPAPQTPRSQHCRHREARHKMPSRPIQTPHEEGNPHENRDRSQSRTSNISKKRSTIKKRRNRPAPERKREAMHHVASGLLTEKENEVTETQKRCQELERQGLQATDENQRLTGEVESLNDQLEKFQKHADGLKEKYRTYRSKLNEAIAEQQALFMRSREFYQTTKKELEDEKADRVTDSLKIKDVIETAHKTYDEMKSRLEEVRMQAERDCHDKERAVSELEGKLEQQTVELVYERDSAAELRQRIKDQSKIQESVARVESKVQSLLERGTDAGARCQTQRETSDQLSYKLDLVIKQLELLRTNAAETAAIEPVVERLEKKIISKLLPAMLTIISEQTRQERSTELFKNDILAQLEQFQSVFARQDEKKSQYLQKDESFHQVLLDLLGEIAAHTSKSEMTYRRAEQQFAKWTHGQKRQQEDFETSLQNKITQQLRVWESTINAQEQQLKLVSGDLSNKIDAINGITLQRDDEKKKHLQELIESIQNTIDNGFKETNARADKERAQIQSFQAILETHFEEVEEKLNKPSPGESDSAVLRQALNEEQKIATDLRQQLTQLERDASTSKGLNERWRKEIEAVNAMRDQLKDITERLPQVKVLEAKLQHVIQGNQAISSTASYLAAERLWVNQQLGNQSESDISDDDIDQKRQAPREGNWRDGRITPSSSGQPMTTNPPKILMDLCDPGRGITSREEYLGRKVVVNSPRDNTDSPFPPPSIEQEQLRRREAATPRSILRTPASSAQDSMQEPQLPRIPLHQDKYNRLATGKPSSTAATAKQEVIDQIRSGLVQPRQLQSHYDFPTVADFKRDAKCHWDEKDATVKKRLSDSIEQEQSPSTKKMKAEDVASQTLTQASKNPGPQGKVAKRRPVQITYSRKQNSENEC